MAGYNNNNNNIYTNNNNNNKTNNNSNNDNNGRNDSCLKGHCIEFGVVCIDSAIVVN